MAIASFTNSFKLRLPFRRRSKPRTGIPQPETANYVGGGDDKEGEFRQVFRYLDANNDGMIAAGELSAYFASIGDSVSHEAAEKIIREFSKGGGAAAATENSSPLLEFDDFMQVMELRDSEDDSAVLRRAFEMYVADNGGGCITAEGLLRGLRRLGDVRSHQECEEMIRVFDLDGNGVLDFHEFHKMMT
ncbi:hypothetical protein ABFS82_03G054100 [Erythranthe guttata]|uniref:EF-hand domain-containing protein n=1 Tax=Erythranthe guttata TaxID=4155 RepID=A0A022RX69_ERYGU|nr:PREDICTED: probable calcium-binding protein CML41 [Erythranthe guttata]EYU45102.1 hypothetical protein MIMGU_mgv1a019246mg [Erythranthe guttata]|eukprot:XP_012846282.1 PREDICTED: probable calcium-binding protein CML41 [Erythranthe guttata]